MKIATKTDIKKQVSILAIAQQFGINVGSVSAGNFDYSCHCPSDEHKSGKEKTSSCFINSVDNNFWCFGCNKGSSCIDFYMFCTGKTFIEALTEMKSMVKTPGAYSDVVDQKKVMFPVFVDTSSIIREFLTKYPDQLDKMTGLLQKIDKLSFESSKEDFDKITKMNIKLRKMLEEN